MIKTAEQIEKIKASGKINYQTHQYLKEHIVPGVTTMQLNELADEFIRRYNCIPAFLGFQGFPGSICISINDEVVHGIPSERTLKDGDIVSIDIGVIKDGYYSDSAWTYPVGEVNAEKKRLMHHSEKALYIGLKEIKDGAHVNNIGARIDGYAKKQGYGVVRDLVGHGVGIKLHEDPDVPNFGKYGTGIILKTGMVIAVEPMINTGTREISIKEDGWTIITNDGKPSAHYEHTVLVTDDGYEILTGE